MSRGHAFALAAAVSLLVAICAAAVGSDGEPQPAEKLGPFPTAEGDNVVILP